ncbi:MAG: Tm-1-like ATP-binding domain-containing protein [Desulfobacterales bacterium]|nr:Tm-1-like ATP-binding domain-containing protein [Desulfobacterales bacterium]
MPKHIAIIATLDTKEPEAAFMAGMVREHGHIPIVIDVGAFTASGKADFSNNTVAAQAGCKLERLVQTGERDTVIKTMGQGAMRVLLALLKQGKLDGAIGLGGNQGTAIAAMALRSLPLGFPKFLLSTVASGNMRPYIGNADIGMMFSVADLLGGPNPVSRSVMSNAVAALLGMVERGEPISLAARGRTIALTALGNTEKAANRIHGQLCQRGYQVITFHASGAGGSAMEELMESGIFSGVVDLTPHELSEEVVGAGAYIPVRPGRLTTAGRVGLPQVVSTGGLEYLCFGPKESIPGRLRRRKIYFHNPNNANVKISPTEMAQIGTVMAERLNTAAGPVAVLVPTKGWSVYGSKGGPLFDPKGNRMLLQALKQQLKPSIPYREIDLHINDHAFADICVEALIGFLQERE